MDSFISSIPNWVWIGATVLALLYFLGESNLWEYEAKFPFKEGIGRGEIELCCGSKKGTRIKYRFELMPASQNKPITVSLNGKPMHTIGAEKNDKKRFLVIEYLPFDEPKEGDVVTVSSDGAQWFSGPLVLD